MVSLHRLPVAWECHGWRRTMKRNHRLTRFALTLSVPLALVRSLPGELRADNNAYSFQGQYTAPNCGAPFDFTIGAGTKTIDIVAGAIPANDVVLKLYLNGILIAQ